MLLPLPNRYLSVLLSDSCITQVPKCFVFEKNSKTSFAKNYTKINQILLNSVPPANLFTSNTTDASTSHQTIKSRTTTQVVLANHYSVNRGKSLASWLAKKQKLTFFQTRKFSKQPEKIL
jgi:hypothetical protein